MKSAAYILASKKPAVLRRYLAKLKEIRVPANTPIPTDPKLAYLLGMRMARAMGYEDGLVDGVALGIDVTNEALGEAVGVPGLSLVPAYVS